MKVLKASKRLVTAIIGFVLSLVLCIGVCLAWFAINGEVDANGLNSGMRGINITQFSVTAYTLKDRKTANGVTTFTLGEEATVVDDAVKMENYGNLFGRETALLLEFSYDFDKALGSNYGIFAEFTKTIEDENGVVENPESNGNFLSDLSAATAFYGASLAAGTGGATVVTQSAGLTADESERVNLNNSAATDEHAGTVEKFYCIIDYDQQKISDLYLRVTFLGGSIWSQIEFNYNMLFYIKAIG